MTESKLEVEKLMQLEATTSKSIPSGKQLKTSIFLQRHGETDADKQGVHEGWRQYPLSQEGREQAEKSVKILKLENIKQIYSSNLERAVETARIIAEGLGISDDKIVFDSMLRPLDTGKFTGQLKKGSPISGYDNVEDVPIPGGESVREFRARVHVILESLKRNLPRDGNLLVITHSTVITAMLDERENRHSKLEDETRVKPGGIVSLETVDFRSDGDE